MDPDRATGTWQGRSDRRAYDGGRVGTPDMRRRTATLAIAVLVPLAAAAWWLALRAGGGPGSGPVEGAGGALREEPARPGLATASAPPPAPEREPEEETLDLGDEEEWEGGYVEGTVLDTRGKPAVGCPIRVVGPESARPWIRSPGGHAPRARDIEIYAGATDADGHYYVFRVPTGVPLVVAAGACPDAVVRSEPFTVTRTKECVRRDLQVPPMASLQVLVRGLSFELLRRVSLRVRGLAGTAVAFGPEPVESESPTAMWKVPCPAVGPYDVEATIGGLPRVSAQVTVRPGEATVATLEFGANEVIVGRIVSEDGEPVMSAEVSFEPGPPTSTDSDADGRFRLEGVPPGRGRLVVGVSRARARGAQGYRDRRLADVSVEGVTPGGAPVGVVVPWAPTIAGRWEGAGAGEHVTCDVFEGGAESTQILLTRFDGVFELQVERVGAPVLLVVRGPSGVPVVLDVPSLRAGERRDLGTLTHERGRLLSLTVKGPGGGSVANASVRLVSPWARQSARTDSAGLARFEGLPARPVVATVQAEGLPCHVVRLAPSDDEARQVTLSAGGTIEGRVVAEDGGALTGVIVQIGTAGEGLLPYEAAALRQEMQVEGEMRFRFSVEVGVHRLEARDASGRRTETTVTVADGGTTSVVLRLE